MHRHTVFIIHKPCRFVYIAVPFRIKIKCHGVIRIPAYDFRISLHLRDFLTHIHNDFRHSFSPLSFYAFSSAVTRSPSAATRSHNS
jgi:hypothetical protein